MPKEFEHTEDCARLYKMHLALVADYEKNYPNYCKKCSGWGGKYVKYDPSPRGIALSAGYMTEFEPCPECIEQTICPRCGLGMLFNDEDDDYNETCPECLFKLDETDGLPQEPDCFCHYIY